MHATVDAAAAAAEAVSTRVTGGESFATDRSGVAVWREAGSSRQQAEPAENHSAMDLLVRIVRLCYCEYTYHNDALQQRLQITSTLLILCSQDDSGYVYLNYTYYINILEDAYGC